MRNHTCHKLTWRKRLGHNIGRTRVAGRDTVGDVGTIAKDDDTELRLAMADPHEHACQIASAHDAIKDDKADIVSYRASFPLNQILRAGHLKVFRVQPQPKQSDDRRIVSNH
jgi:hypothetical protein